MEPYASYGIVVRDGIVVDAPATAKWLIGKSTVFARIWIRDPDSTAVKTVKGNK